MKKHWRIPSLSVLSIFGMSLLSGCSHVPIVYNPQGPMARYEFDLMKSTYYITGAVVLLVFSLFAFMMIRYRAKKGDEHIVPEETKDNHLLEIVWTIVPILLVVFLGLVTFKTNAKVDTNPNPSLKPVVINVTSADWKWIFSYPEQGIETINYVYIPANVPIDFKLTSADNMNTFWVPALGGMKYNMNDMNMDLYLEADHDGIFDGKSGNYTGPGFTDMKFKVYAVAKQDFNTWADKVKHTAPALTLEEYKTILKPGNIGTMQFSNTHLKWGNIASVDNQSSSTNVSNKNMDNSMNGMNMDNSKSNTEGK